MESSFPRSRFLDVTQRSPKGTFGGVLLEERGVSSKKRLRETNWNQTRPQRWKTSLITAKRVLPINAVDLWSPFPPLLVKR